jgi:hypothetical protein
LVSEIPICKIWYLKYKKYKKAIGISNCYLKK